MFQVRRAACDTYECRKQPEWFSQRGLVEYALCYPQPKRTLTCRTRLKEKGDSKKRNSNQAEEKGIRSELVIGRICHSGYGPTFSPSDELRGRDCLRIAVKGTRPYNAMLTQALNISCFEQNDGPWQRHSSEEAKVGPRLLLKLLASTDKRGVLFKHHG